MSRRSERVTATNVKKALFGVPATGGATTGTVFFQNGYGRSVGIPYDEYSVLGTDRSLMWWNPNVTGGANAVAKIVGKGKFMYLDDAKRYAYGQFPKNEPTFFDASASIAETPASGYYENGVAPVPNPCGECPSTTSTS